jgi:hypothetical protein
MKGRTNSYPILICNFISFDPFPVFFPFFSQKRKERGKGKRKKNFVSKCLNSIYKLKKCVIILLYPDIKRNAA